MQKLTIKVFFLSILSAAFFLPAAQSQTIPSITNLNYGLAYNSCAPWDGAATEIVISPVKKDCSQMRQDPPFLRISINDRSLQQLTPGVYKIDPKQQLANQASFVYGQPDQKVPLSEFMQFGKNVVLTIKSHTATALTGEVQFIFEDQHSETVAFEALICEVRALCG